jgi:hypothetical protein
MNGFWKTYLLVATDLLIAMGIAFAALGIVPGWYGALDLLNQLVGGGAVTGEESIRTVRFLYGILGAVTAGWGIALFLIVRHGVAGGGTLRLVGGSIAGWYVLDATASVVTGFYVNAAISTILLVAALIVPAIGLTRNEERVPAHG